MIRKESKFYPVFYFKCPRCHEGAIFKNRLSYSFKKITETHENCPNCQLKYEREPGFFYGAMYVSYGITVALWISIAVAMYVLIGEINPWFFLTIGISLLLITLPLVYRLSRAIWLAIFVPFEKEFSSKN